MSFGHAGSTQTVKHDGHAGSVSRDAGRPACLPHFWEAPEFGTGGVGGLQDITHMSEVSVCGYRVLPPREKRARRLPSQKEFIAGHVITSARSVRALARKVNRLRPYTPRDRQTHCPPETSERIYLRFSSSSGGKQSAAIRLSGCRRAVVGRGDRWLHLTSAFEDFLFRVSGMHNH